MKIIGALSNRLQHEIKWGGIYWYLEHNWTETIKHWCLAWNEYVPVKIEEIVTGEVSKTVDQSKLSRTLVSQNAFTQQLKLSNEYSNAQS